MPHILNNAKTKRIRKYQKKKGNIRKKTRGKRPNGRSGNSCFGRIFYFKGKKENEGDLKKIVV